MSKTFTCKYSRMAVWALRRLTTRLLFSSSSCPKGFASTVNETNIVKYREAFYNDSKNILAQNACSRVSPTEVITSRDRVQECHHFYSHKIESEGKPVTNQRSSGRCWIFACLNVIRVPFIKHFNLEEFEFSQAFVFFWDKIERSNYFLNAIVQTAKRGESVDDRTTATLLSKPIEDGGQWDMLVNIITKYGLMPKKNFPESFSCETSSTVNIILNSKLREFAIVLHKLVSDHATDNEIKNKIEEQMEIVYRIVGICFGIPPNTFEWNYYDKSKQYQSIGPITPLDFYEQHVKPIFDVTNKVCLVSDPRPNNCYGQLYTLDMLNNMVGGRKVLYNNQPVEILIKAAQDSIVKRGEPVWYGCQVSKRFSDKLGLEDLKIHNYQLVFGTDVSVPMSKAERMLYGESAMTHAMVLTGVNLNNGGEPNKWRVENSWGEDRGDKGYLMMTTEWFKEYVFEVVVDKSLVPDEVLVVFQQEPQVLPIWDPMGTLA
ncbi:bleomycin hydrolase isoform X2 [Daktulosphaira vitifoliae]|uniref:bleomycin hydrolase isoform X2 n=1 Tax=Daktulosphaira vitifoliae TaxID=58002 RepID=UPI0021AAA069|nr:bleomycin hydrolase isoform X2 [Daktulosphaira vitifoliae]